MRLVNLPALRKKSLETLSHTALSAVHHLLHRSDVALVFNAGNAPFLPLVRAAGVPIALHVDGLEWRRGKWGPTGRRYYLRCERLGVRWADALIADAVGIQDYYQERYGAPSVYIAYGAPILHEPSTGRLGELRLTDGGYHLVVARLEPENNVDAVMLGYTQSTARLPLVVVGSVPHESEHLARLGAIGAADDRIRMVGGVYDQELLDQLYAGCASYLHGHSVGGTNPSLLRAMGAAAPVLAGRT
jgi:glycosyltransferase involved in cell wall biosynthesis